MDASGRPPTDQQPDGPLLGVKFGAVVSVDGTLRFESTTRRAQHSRCYDVESRAVCQLGMDHLVPSWACSCGFYAMPDEQALATAWGEARLSHWAVLRVEVSGRVIEHERGWRASRQVVVEAAWEDRCHRCGRTAHGFGFDGERAGPVVPLCRTCAGRSLWTAGELAGRLGTDVRLVPTRDPARWSVVDVETVRRRWRRDLARRLVMLTACGLGVAVVVSAASHGAPDVPPSLGQELAPWIEVRDADRTAASLAEKLSDGRSFAVIADSSRERTVEGVAVFDPTPDVGCQALFVFSRPGPDGWEEEQPNPEATDLAACAAWVSQQLAPATVSPPTTTLPVTPTERTTDG